MTMTVEEATLELTARFDSPGSPRRRPCRQPDSVANQTVSPTRQCRQPDSENIGSKATPVGHSPTPRLQPTH